MWKLLHLFVHSSSLHKKHLDVYVGRQQSSFEVTVIDLMKYLATKDIVTL